MNRAPAPSRVTRFEIWVAVILGVAGIAALVILGFSRLGRCRGEDIPVVAFFPTSAAIRTDLEIRYYGDCVGRVTQVRPGIRAVELSVAPVGTDGTVGVGAPVTLPLEPDLGQGVALRPVAAGADAAPALRLDGDGDDIRVWRGVGGADTVLAVAPTDSISLDGLVLSIGTTDIYTVVRGFIDESEFRDAAADAGVEAPATDPRLALGPGSSIEPLGGIALLGGEGEPRHLRLVPSFDPSGLARPLFPDPADRENEIAAAEVDGRVEGRELRAMGLSTLQRDLARTAEFLLSPTGRGRTPSSRVETVAADFQDIVAGLDRFVASIDSVRARGGGEGVIGRLALSDEALDEIESALSSASVMLDSFQAALERGDRRPPIAALALAPGTEDSLRALADRLTRFAADIDSTSGTPFARLFGPPAADRLNSMLVSGDSLLIEGRGFVRAAEEAVADLREGLPAAGRTAAALGGVLGIAALIAAIASIP